MKRYAELRLLQTQKRERPKEPFEIELTLREILPTQKPEKAAGRSYLRSDMEWLGSMGASSGYLSVLVLALYINSDDVRLLYDRPQALWLICPLLLYWVTRMWSLAYRGRVEDDPIVVTFKDRLSYGVGIAAAIILLIAT